MTVFHDAPRSVPASLSSSVSMRAPDAPVVPEAPSQARRRPAPSAALRTSSCVGGLFALSLLSQAMAQTLPTTATIISGQATIDRTTSAVTIQQSTQKLITHWKDFSVGAGGTVSFQQPNAAAVALNRVTGSTVSTIEGTLTANGRVFLINPTGIVVAAGANVSLGSLVASTLDLQDDDFLSGRYRFSGPSKASVINRGRIAASTSSEDAYVALIANEVTNEGSLHAGLHGTVALGAGEDVTLQMGGPIQLRMAGTAARAIINNSGSLVAPSGQVLLSARGSSDLKTVVINQSGRVDATGVSLSPAGRIQLTAEGGAVNVSGAMDASAASSGGSISIQGGTVALSSGLLAQGDAGGGGTGGRIDVNAGSSLTVGAGGRLDVRGDNGGTVTLGTAGALVQAGQVNASGYGSGHGGAITLAAGTSLNTDTSIMTASQQKGADGSLSMTAPSWTIGTAAGANLLSAAQLGDWLDTGHRVALRSSNDITLNTGLTRTTADGSLALTAGRSVLLNAGLQVGKAGVSVVANAQDADLRLQRAAGAGVLTMKASTQLTTGGAVVLKVDGDAAATQSGMMALTKVEAGALTVDSAAFAGRATAQDRVYDGTRQVTLAAPGITGLTLSGSNLTVGATASFGDKSVGTAKAVTGSFTLAGFDVSAPTRTTAVNRHAQPLAFSGTASITPRTLTLSQWRAADKIYDGNTDAVATVGVDDRVAGDQLQLSWVAAFDNKQVGGQKQVTISKVQLSGADAANYRVAAGPISAQASITARRLTLSGLSAADKIYDGTADATASFSNDDRVAGDSLSAQVQASFDNKQAGHGKRVQVGSATLSGTDAANYEVVLGQEITTASIGKRLLVLNGLSAQDRVYDGTQRADVSFAGDDRVTGDRLTVLATGQFDTAHAGLLKRVSLTRLALAGEDADNYRIDPTVGETTASIFKRTLTVSQFSALNKVYDGNRVAKVVIGADDRLAGDDLTLTPIASFDTKAAGTRKTVSVDAIALSGAHAADYSIDITGLRTTASIDRRVLSLSELRAMDKVYDGTQQAQVTYGRNDRIAGDDVQVAATGQFDTRRVGTAKLVTVSGVSLSGADAANYVADFEGHSTRATIDPRVLKLSGLRADNKTYDGSLAAQVHFAGDDRVAGDDLKIAATANFDTKNAGTGKTVTVTDLVLSGGDAANYRVQAVGATTQASIAQRLLTLSELVALDKVYDQTVQVQVGARRDDRVKGDELAVALTGHFDTRHAGQNKTVTVTGIQLSGEDAPNYRVGSQPLFTTASITPRILKVGITASDKVYDGRSEAVVSFQDDRLTGDVLKLTGGVSQFADAAAGQDKTVTASQWRISGADAGNYVLDAPSWQTKASILPRVLHVTAPSSIEFSKYLRPQSVVIGHDALQADGVQVVAGQLRWGASPGLRRAAQLTDFSIQGKGAGNYVVDAASLTTAAIVQAPLPLPGVSGQWLCAGDVQVGCTDLNRAAGQRAMSALATVVAQNDGTRGPTGLVVRDGGIRTPEQHLQDR